MWSLRFILTVDYWKPVVFASVRNSRTKVQLLKILLSSISFSFTFIYLLATLRSFPRARRVGMIAYANSVPLACGTETCIMPLTDTRVCCQREIWNISATSFLFWIQHSSSTSLKKMLAYVSVSWLIFHQAKFKKIHSRESKYIHNFSCSLHPNISFADDTGHFGILNGIFLMNEKPSQTSKTAL